MSSKILEKKFDLHDWLWFDKFLLLIYRRGKYLPGTSAQVNGEFHTWTRDCVSRQELRWLEIVLPPFAVSPIFNTSVCFSHSQDSLLSRHENWTAAWCYWADERGKTKSFVGSRQDKKMYSRRVRFKFNIETFRARRAKDWKLDRSNLLCHKKTEIIGMDAVITV